MTKDNRVTILIVLMFFIMNFNVHGQEPLWKVAYNYEQNGNYSEAILLKKQLAKEDYGTEWYIDDIAGIARCYSYTSEKDSTLYYGQYAIDLAKDIINKADSVAEEYIQNSAWCFYRSNLYPQAVTAAEMVLSLREKIHGNGSAKYIEWLGVMSYQAFNHNQIDDMVKYCDNEITIAREIYGLQSAEYEDAISSIRGYAHGLSTLNPSFVIQWIKPYYNEICSLGILPTLQYEFEILGLECNLDLNDLKEAYKYSELLNKRTYVNNPYISPENQPQRDEISLEDNVRILLKLAHFYLHIGEHAKARIYINYGWELLDEAGIEPSMAQLIDRHNTELNLRCDDDGQLRMNTEWIIESSSQIISSHQENPETLAFFYNSRAWAYGEILEYEKAISDIQNSISLKSLWSRVKKLAQFQMSNGQYEEALDTYEYILRSPDLSEKGRKSIESDLVFLYWAKGDLAKLAQTISTDVQNMKDDVKQAFAFMNEDEREVYIATTLLNSALYFDVLTSFSNSHDQWTAGNKMAYDLVLCQKGLLLSTAKDIKRILDNAPYPISERVRGYNKLLSDIPAISGMEDPIIKDLRWELMEYVATSSDFLKQLDLSHEDIRNALSENEYAVEFIPLMGVNAATIEKEPPVPAIGALILSKDTSYPTFIRLASINDIEALLSTDDYGDVTVDDVAYKGENKRKLYELIWMPIVSQIPENANLYYSPTSILHNINHDLLGRNDDDFICQRFNMYRLSSTKQIYEKAAIKLTNASLYGDIQYALTTPAVSDSPTSKFRSITRAGFGKLKGTAEEIDSIRIELDEALIECDIFNKSLATEQSFRSLSGKSPSIIHVATHGFYYSKEAIERELNEIGNWNFIRLQIIGTELDRSGLALSGAQDSWRINEQNYFDLEKENDGILLASEIANIDLSRTILVVLSACETARGKVTSDGVYGLQRAFKLAGVSSLIMSLWKVNDEATKKLMIEFYRNYLNGMSMRKSLLAAQMKVRETPGFEDPEYWAGWILLDALN